MNIDPQSLDVSSLPSMLLSDRSQLPKISCVYFAISSGNIQYIGRSVNLHSRWTGHHRTNCLATDSHIAWIEVSNLDLLPEIEAALIYWFKPPLNRHFDKENRIFDKPIPPNENKYVCSILVKLTPTEKAVLRELADNDGIDMADILRRPIIDELKRRRQEAIAS
jgi:hypothetical protein